MLLYSLTRRNPISKSTLLFVVRLYIFLVMNCLVHTAYIAILKILLNKAEPRHHIRGNNHGQLVTSLKYKTSLNTLRI